MDGLPKSTSLQESDLFFHLRPRTISWDRVVSSTNGGISKASKSTMITVHRISVITV